METSREPAPALGGLPRGSGAAAEASTDAFDLFLSYHGPDRPAVRAVCQALQARGLATFVDRDALVPGLSWPEALERALRRARGVAVFLGPQGLGPWQKREVGFALERQVQAEREGRAFPVIPVLLPGGDPVAGFLFLNTWVDVREDPTDPAGLDALVRAVRGEAPPIGDGAGAAHCPFRGLQTFREEHAAVFFGREAFVDRLWDAVRARAVVAVVGASGSGKSSVVQAGLLPRLRRQRPPATSWDAVVCTPGDRPFHRLADALLPQLEPGLGETDRLAEAQKLGDRLAGGEVRLEAAVERLLAKSGGTERLLLVADQFEELFTLAPEAARAPFVEALLQAAERAPLTLLLTLRADFYGHAVVLSRALSERLEQGVLNLGPMAREELQRAIEAPAYRVGLRLEPGLVERILDDVLGQPGALPLLEHALLELWERRQGPLLTLGAYQAIGGVEGALAGRAEEAFARLPPDQRPVARRILLRLTQPGEGTEDTRRRAALSELVTRPQDGAAVEAVVRALADARLLTTGGDARAGEPTVEVAHEALIRGWPELRRWIDEDRAGLRVHRRLTEAAQDWQQRGRDESLLFRGLRLAEALEWQARNVAALNELERAFLNAGAALRSRERWAARRRTLAIGVMGIIVLLSVGAFMTQQQIAAENAERAEAAKRDLLAQQVLARLQQQAVAPMLASLKGHTEAITDFAPSPDGRTIVTASGDRTARVWDIRTSRELHKLQHEDAVSSARFSPDGRFIVTGSEDGSARIWEADTGVLRHFLADMGLVVAKPFVAIGPDGRLIVTPGENWSVLVSEADTGMLVVILKGHTSVVNDAVFSPDGRQILTASMDKTARVWDVRSGTAVRMLPHPDPILGAAFSPDGSTVITVGVNGRTWTWDRLTGEILGK